MSNDFDTGMEAAFDGFRKAAGDESITFNGEEIPAIVDGFIRQTAVGNAGTAATVTGTLSLKVADWISYGMKKGSRITLPWGRGARVESEPQIPASGEGVIDVGLVAE